MISKTIIDMEIIQAKRGVGDLVLGTGGTVSGKFCKLYLCLFWKQYFQVLNDTELLPTL